MPGAGSAAGHPERGSDLNIPACKMRIFCFINMKYLLFATPFSSYYGIVHFQKQWQPVIWMLSFA